MLTLQNITNAFVKLTHDGRTLLADPWVSDGIFDGGWSPFPPIADPDAALSACDYLYVSHIHEDHFDVGALERLPRSCQVVVLDMFPNHIIQKQLVDLGFTKVTMLEPFASAQLAGDLELDVIPPMNMFAQELEYYQKGIKSVAVDAGALVVWDGLKVLLLNDNTPYDRTILEPHLSRLQNCDLLALNYNGAADDYPVCYRGMTEEEKIRISDRRDEKKFIASCDLIALLKPKAVMPYSSEFSVRGPQARAFARIKTSMYNDKARMAEALEKATGVPAVYAYEQDRLEIDRQGIRKIQGPPVTATLHDRAEALYSEQPNYERLYADVPGDEWLHQTADRAAAHMFRFMDKLQLKSDWVFQVTYDSNADPIRVDLRDRKLVTAADSGRKTLTCFTDRRYLAALLKKEGHAHWNNAMISYNLEWERRPNEYDPFLYDSINFFHI